MDRIEFLSILRESLEGCIPLEDVEENVTFYRNYFDNADRFRTGSDTGTW